MSQGTDYEIDEVDQENPPKEFQDLLIDNILSGSFYIMVLWPPSVLVSLTLFIRHSTRPFSIPSAPRGTREECNDDRRAETPERMGCGMERGLRDKHSIFRKLSVLQLYPCG